MNVQLTLAFVWLIGCVFGVMVRAMGWLADQPPDDATLSNWWHLKRWSNLQSLLIGILGVGVWCDGTLFRYLKLDGAGMTLTFGLTFIAGAAATYGARYILSKFDKTAADKAEDPPKGD